MAPEEARRRMTEIKRHGRNWRAAQAALKAKGEASRRRVLECYDAGMSCAEAAEALGRTPHEARCRLYYFIGTTIWKGDQKQ